ncbi:MAG: hypothetical protein NTX50_19105, partial [Candidatus Sumerlaeota bacterium]|nr:hypothetical protein [Candidatus Sumerlaeota bacterium]
MTRTVCFSLFAAAFLLVISMNARGVAPVWESFEYADPQTFKTADTPPSPGAGFTDRWRVNPGTNGNPQTYSPGMAYPANVTLGPLGIKLGSQPSDNARKPIQRPIDTTKLDIDLSIDADYFVSYLYSIPNNATYTNLNGWLSLNNTSFPAAAAVNIEVGHTTRSMVLQGALINPARTIYDGAAQNTTYFIVMWIAAKASPAMDKVYVKVYKSTDIVHAKPQDINGGEGSGANQWTIISDDFDSSLHLNYLLLNFKLQANSAPKNNFMDEIKISTSWADVASAMWGQITAPPSGTTYNYPDTITVDVAATSTLGVSTCQIFDGATPLVGASLVSGPATDGVWRATLPPLTVATHNINAQITDTAGSVKNVTTITITRLRPPQAVQMLNPLTGSFLSNPVTVDVATTSMLNTVDCSIFDGATSVAQATLVSGTPTAGAWNVTLPAIAGGAHNLTARITDADGFTSTSTPNTFITIFQVLPEQRKWFVSTTPSGAADGSSWANATTFSAAVANACYWGNGSLFLKEGLYPMEFDLTITTGVAIYGGFDGTEPEAGVPGNRIATFAADNPTTLSGSGIRRVLSVNTSGQVRFDGLGFENGYSTGNGAALLSTYADLTVTTCTFLSNWSNGGNGGAV